MSDDVTCDILYQSPPMHGCKEERKMEKLPIEEALEGQTDAMYNPKGRLLAWIRKVFNYHPTKYVVRSKQRDPHNWGNRENVLCDKELIVADTKDELIAKLLDSHNHMSKNICYLTYPNGKIVYDEDSQKILIAAYERGE